MFADYTIPNSHSHDIKNYYHMSTLNENFKYKIEVVQDFMS